MTTVTSVIRAAIDTNILRASNHRRSIRLQGYDYTQARAYFVMVVAQGAIVR